MARNERLIILRKSDGWVGVPANSGMFSSCIAHCGIACGLGEGGVGVFVGGGSGDSDVAACVKSVTKYSGVLSNVVCSLTRKSEDSDVDGENSDTVGDGVNAKEMLLQGAIFGVIVSAWAHEAKHLCSRCWFFQASVDRSRAKSTMWARCTVDT